MRKRLRKGAVPALAGAAQGQRDAAAAAEGIGTIRNRVVTEKGASATLRWRPQLPSA
jgi:hypothetical protein